MELLNLSGFIIFIIQNIVRKLHAKPRGADLHGRISISVRTESLKENGGETTEDKREIWERKTEIWNKKIVQTGANDWGRLLSNI